MAFILIPIGVGFTEEGKPEYLEKNRGTWRKTLEAEERRTKLCSHNQITEHDYYLRVIHRGTIAVPKLTYSGERLSANRICQLCSPI